VRGTGKCLHLGTLAASRKWLLRLGGSNLGGKEAARTHAGPLLAAQTDGALHAPSAGCAPRFRCGRQLTDAQQRALRPRETAATTAPKEPTLPPPRAARAAPVAHAKDAQHDSQRWPTGESTPLRVRPGRCQQRNKCRVSCRAQTGSASAAVPLASGAARNTRRVPAPRRARGGAAARRCVRLQHNSVAHSMALREHGPPRARALSKGHTRRT